MPFGYAFIMNEGFGFDIEEKNFENMVIFNKSKLLQIIKGKSAYKLFSSSARKRLRDTGVLVFENDVTAGDYVRAIVSCYTFDTDNNQGVSFNVSGVQRVKETEEPLYQPTPVDSVFADVSFDIEPEVQAEANTEEW